MTKISTAEIRKRIVGWLGTAELKEDLKGYYVQDDSSPCALVRYAERFGAPVGSSKDEIEEFIWKLWSDGSQWKREEKSRLKDNWKDWLSCENSKPYFPEDFAGGHSSALLAEYCGDPVQAPTCWYRLFVPKNSLGDNFRLEVVSTPDDFEIIGWCVTVD